MKKSIDRSLNILDGMLIVAGVAIGAAFTRLYLVNNYDSFFGRLRDTPDNLTYVRWIIGEFADFSCLWLTALAPIALFIRLRCPRPNLARLLLQPGFTASMAVAVIVTIGSLLTAIVVCIEGNGPWFYYYQVYLIRLFPYAGACVVAVWSIQALGRRWRAEAGPIDRIGRFLGACWIATFLAGTWTMLQEGAWSSRSMNDYWILHEQGEENAKDKKVEENTEELKDLRERLTKLQSDSSQLKHLIEVGDKDQMRAALDKGLESYSTQEGFLKERIADLQKQGGMNQDTD